MNGLSIADNLIRLRRDRKITQIELADFMGVTKAAVSKWESGKSMPDILLLSQLAAFFGVTVDELLGYEEQLSPEQIRKIYGDLCEKFTELPFEEAMKEARNCVHRYYSCYPFLLQMGILYMNHAMLAETKEAYVEILQEAESFCDHILERCRESSICEDATSLKTALYLQLGKAKEAVFLLEDLADPARISGQSDLMLVQAYQQAGEIGKAKSYTQIRIYSHLMSLVSGEILFLSLHEKELERCEETIRRVKGIMELYHLEELHLNLASRFYFQAALVYAANGREEETLAELEHFAKCVCAILDAHQSLLHGDAYFDCLEEWIESLPLGNMAPRDLKFSKQSALQALSHPSFTAVKDTERFQQIYRHISKGGKENA